MDEHKEKEADKFHESSEQQQPLKPEAADDDEDTSKESMDQQQHQEGYKEATTAEEEPTVQRRKEVESGSEEASSPLGIFAHPCSLLQYLLRAFSGWCWAPLHGAFDDGPKPQQAVAPEAVAPANSTEQGGGDGMKADNVSGLYHGLINSCSHCFFGYRTLDRLMTTFCSVSTCRRRW